MTLDRISTGQRQLDVLLGGGLPRNAITLIGGQPGTGKTMLAQQFLFHNATNDRPGIYLATASEPLDKIVRFGQELAFFDPRKVGTAIIYESVAEELKSGGLDAVSERILRLIRDARPGMLVIDSFKAFAPYAASPLAYRSFVSELAGRVTALPITTIWVGEYGSPELMELPEAAVADAIVVLRSLTDGPRTSRSLQVLKLRGGDFLSGHHAYRLTDDGLRAFPRLADPVDLAEISGDVRRVSTGTEGLDRMLDGGVFEGSTTLVVGPSGAGKTMLGIQFLRAAEPDGPGVFASLQENPSQLARLLHRGETDGAPDDGIIVHRRSPVDIYIDEWVYEVLDRVESTGARKLVLDSLSDLRIAAPDAKRFEEYTYSLIQRLGSMGVTALMTLESPPSLGFADLPATTLSHLADNIVLLGYQVQGSTVGRGIHVMKARASSHDHDVREFRIDGHGISVLEPMTLPPAVATRTNGASAESTGR